MRKIPHVGVGVVNMTYYCQVVSCIIYYGRKLKVKKEGLKYG